MTKKKSFLERMGLVEPEEVFNQEEVIESLQMQSQAVDEQIYLAETPQLTVQFGEDEDFLTVSEVYEKFDVADLDKSIFKVEEFGGLLPDLPTDVKRQTVIGILATSGLETEELYVDAEKRIEALKEVSAVTTENSNQVIVTKEQEIADLSNQIDALKQDVINRKVSQEQQDKIIKEELEKIGSILEFISAK